MSDAFQRLYDATPFDPDDPLDQIGEVARQMVLTSALGVIQKLHVKTPEETNIQIGGMIVGLVQVMQASFGASDEVDAAIRASIIQTAPWAVDLARTIQGKGPLGHA